MKSTIIIKLLCILLFFVHPPGVKLVNSKLSDKMKENTNNISNTKFIDKSSIKNENTVKEEKHNRFKKLEITNNFESFSHESKPTILSSSNISLRKQAKSATVEDEKINNTTENNEKKDYTEHIKNFFVTLWDKSQIYGAIIVEKTEPIIRTYKIQIILYIILFSLLVLLAKKILNGKTKLNKEEIKKEKEEKPKNSKTTTQLL